MILPVRKFINLLIKEFFIYWLVHLFFIINSIYCILRRITSYTFYYVHFM